MLPTLDTIAAIASPSGGAARGIVRLSGPDAVAIANQIFTADPCEDSSSGTSPSARVGHFLLESGRRLPGQLLTWPTTRSYTREPVAEIHTLGSPPLLDAILARLRAGGARLARPGEFTQRAFLAGRLDLTRAEAVLGVIDARGEEALRVALAQLAGGLATPLTALRGQLLDLLAHLEAGLDFVEEDLDFIDRVELRATLAQSSADVHRIADQLATRGQANESARIVLCGWPNAGKSSLFNALLGRSAAIVAERAGTTRDYLSAPLELEGIPCTLVDTAGAEPAIDEPLAQAAQAAAEHASRAADVCVLCLDASRGRNAWEESALAGQGASPHLIVATKCDLPLAGPLPPDAASTSSATGLGLAELRARLAELAARAVEGEANPVASTAARARECLARATIQLTQAEDLAATSAGDEFVAEEIRAALESLGEVVGAVYTDDLLDRIFSRFCIGK